MIVFPDAFRAPPGADPPRDRYVFGVRPTRAAVLLVHAGGQVRRKIERKLIRAGLSVVAVGSFDQGRWLLADYEPDVLIADVRLGAFNGLHLASLSHGDRPDVPVFITHPTPDLVFEREAAACGARFVVAPADNPDFVPDVQARAAMKAGRRVTPQ